MNGRKWENIGVRFIIQGITVKEKGSLIEIMIEFNCPLNYYVRNNVLF